MLRASSEHAGSEIDLSAVTRGDASGDVGIPHADVLVAYAEAVIEGSKSDIDAARKAVNTAMGDEATVDSAAVICLFNAIDRVADATGAPLEDDKAADTAGMRADIGIDSFAETKAALHD